MPSFLNYLRTITGRYDYPLKYICKKRDAPDPTPNPDFIYDYVSMALLYDEAFIIDSSEVLTLIMSFIAGNTKIQPRVSNVDSRMAFKALVPRYEGLDLHSVDIVKADEVIDSLYYAVEKKPTSGGRSLKTTHGSICYL